MLFCLGLVKKLYIFKKFPKVAESLILKSSLFNSLSADGKKNLEKIIYNINAFYVIWVSSDAHFIEIWH